MPTYTVKYVHSVLDEVDRTMSAAQKASLHERLPPGCIPALRAKNPVETVDGAVVVGLFSALRGQLGDAAYVQWWRQYTERRLMQLPLLKTMVDALMKLFQPTPHVVLRNIPRARGALVRGGGTIEYARIDDTSARITLSGYPPQLLVEGVAGLTMAGVYEGVVALAGTNANAVVEREDIVAGIVVHRVSWGAPA